MGRGVIQHDRLLNSSKLSTHLLVCSEGLTHAPIVQVFAIFVEATRVTLIQILLGGKDMSPLKTLYFFAPVHISSRPDTSFFETDTMEFVQICLAANAVLVLPVEGFEAIWALKTLGPLVLLSNASLTFLLNLSTVYLIGLSRSVSLCHNI